MYGTKTMLRRCGAPLALAFSLAACSSVQPDGHVPEHGRAALPQAPLALAERVADYQLAYLAAGKLPPSAVHETPDPKGWVQGAFLVGLGALAERSTKPTYGAMLRLRGEANGWQLGARTFHADDQVIGQTYASLLSDPRATPPESSGTGFFTFGMAWGVSHGLLDRAIYEPVARRGWAALVRAVLPDGRLGWVQQVGDQPDAVTVEDSQYYGTGAFLLAAGAIADLDAHP
jgi:rhamnogalacturonyl hydrolase YesR